MKSKAMLLFSCLVVLSCGKKTEINGVVYSRHNIPVPNVSISLQQYKESNYPERTFNAVATTDSKGAYHYSARISNNYLNELECVCDSGSATGGVTPGKNSTVDLHLN